MHRRECWDLKKAGQGRARVKTHSFTPGRVYYSLKKRHLSPTQHKRAHFLKAYLCRYQTSAGIRNFPMNSVKMLYVHP